jgi:hypothetical protein
MNPEKTEQINEIHGVGFDDDLPPILLKVLNLNQTQAMLKHK